MTRALMRSSFVLALIIAGCGGDDGGSGDGGPGVCGNGIQEGSEECDDGEANSDSTPDACRTTCLLPECGDGVVDDDEDCDDGVDNSDSTPDACRTTCDEASCGDGVVDEGEECDNGDDNSNTAANACRLGCVAAACGDGVLDSGEDCDDGDDVDDNECSNACDVVILWSGRLSNAAGYGIAVAADDGVVVVGDVFVGDSSELWVRKYTADGEESWTQTYAGSAGVGAVGRGVAIDSGGNIIVCGSEASAAGDSDILVRKYDSSGNVVWTETHAGAGADADSASGVAVDSGNNVIVVGRETTVGAGLDAWVRKYTDAGDPSWTATYDGIGGHDGALAVAVDGSDNVLVAGQEAAALGAENALLLKYDSAGNPLWTRTYVGDDGYVAGAEGVAVDSSGAVVIVGTEAVGTTSANLFVRKYDSAGNDLWTEVYDGPEGDYDQASAVATDSDDNLLVAGLTVAAGGVDAWTAKYDSSGTLAWTRLNAGPANSADVGQGVAVDSQDNVLVVGYRIAGSSPSLWLAKYVP